MKYIKCARCELNYHTEEEEYCKICVKELKGEAEPEDTEPDGDICPFCEENILPYGEEMCKACSAVHNVKDDEDSAVPIKNKINFIEIDE